MLAFRNSWFFLNSADMLLAHPVGFTARGGRRLITPCRALEKLDFNGLVRHSIEKALYWKSKLIPNFRNPLIPTVSLATLIVVM